MLAAVAFCPSPPLLHPAVSTGAAGELDALRQASLAAVAELCASAPDRVVAVGPAPRTGAYAVDARGSMGGFGVELVLGRGTGPVELPSSLALAAWLLDEAGYDGPVHPVGVAEDADGQTCVSLGASLVAGPEPVALLVMGDGSARRDAKAPGAFDERAEGFDHDVLEALVALDLDRLAALDGEAARELMASGRPAWQVAAGAAAAADGAGAERLVGALAHESAPYGVAYRVVTWRGERAC